MSSQATWTGLRRTASESIDVEEASDLSSGGVAVWQKDFGLIRLRVDTMTYERGGCAVKFRKLAASSDGSVVAGLDGDDIVILRLTQVDIK